MYRKEEPAKQAGTCRQKMGAISDQLSEVDVEIVDAGKQR
jgi:hypothetical protein